MRYESKNCYVRHVNFEGNGGSISCLMVWKHVTFTTSDPIHFIDGKAKITSPLDVSFNNIFWPNVSIDWKNLDDKIEKKLERFFDRDESPKDGVSAADIKKLEKMGFNLISDEYLIDKNSPKAEELIEII